MQWYGLGANAAIHAFASVEFQFAPPHWSAITSQKPQYRVDIRTVVLQALKGNKEETREDKRMMCDRKYYDKIRSDRYP